MNEKIIRILNPFGGTNRMPNHITWVRTKLGALWCLTLATDSPLWVLKHYSCLGGVPPSLWLSSVCHRGTLALISWVRFHPIRLRVLPEKGHCHPWGLNPCQGAQRHSRTGETYPSIGSLERHGLLNCPPPLGDMKRIMMFYDGGPAWPQLIDRLYEAGSLDLLQGPSTKATLTEELATNAFT